MGSNEVAGYQADMGHIEPKYISLFSDHTPEDMDQPFSLWGSLVDECRSDTSRYPSAYFFPVVFLGIPDQEEIKEIVKSNDWNEIKVIANKTHIEIKVNGISTVKFTEDQKVAEDGCICLQAHAGDPFEIQYKDVMIREL